MAQRSTYSLLYLMQSFCIALIFVSIFSKKNYFRPPKHKARARCRYLLCTSRYPVPGESIASEQHYCMRNAKSYEDATPSLSSSGERHG